MAIDDRAVFQLMSFIQPFVYPLERARQIEVRDAMTRYSQTTRASELFLLAATSRVLEATS